METPAFLEKVFNIKSSLASLVLRIAAGGLMLTHGFPKFKKLLSGDYKFGDPIGLGVDLSFYLTVFSEFFCAILLIIGLLTRWVSLPLIFTMLVAAFIVHAGDPIGDKELALFYLAAYIAIFFLGGGKYSVDHLISKNKV